MRREEKLIKVEEQVQKDKDDAVVERRELFQTRRGKQQELRNLEFKIEMAELVCFPCIVCLQNLFIGYKWAYSKIEMAELVCFLCIISSSSFV